MKINIISAVGNPRDLKTWSGTSYHIYKELKDLNCIEKVYAIDSNKILSKIIDFYYRKISPIKKYGALSWKLQRYLKASYALKLTKSSNSNCTLHFGTLSLPFLFLPKNQQHYLYTDGVWNLWSKYSATNKHYPQKIINNIDNIEKKTFQQVSHIFSTSKYVKENIINHYGINPNKITVVGTGTGLIKPFLGKKNYSNGQILFVAKGRFNDKGGYLVLEAFNKAIKKNPLLHLNIVGQNDYKNIGQQPNVNTYGYVSIEKLQHLFDTNSLFLMPALNEPWGLVYIEAMLCKMPIMGLNRNSFPELSGYGKYGIGIDEPNPDILANKIIEIFEYPDRMLKMGSEAQKFATKNYNWNSTVEKIIKKIEFLQVTI